MSLRIRIILLSLAVTTAFVGVVLGAQHLLNRYYIGSFESVAKRGISGAQEHINERARQLEGVAARHARRAFDEQISDVESFCSEHLQAVLDREMPHAQALLSDEQGHVVWASAGSPFALGERAESIRLVPGQAASGVLDTAAGPVVAASVKIGQRDAALTLTLVHTLSPKGLPTPAEAGFRAFRFVEVRPRALLRRDRNEYERIVASDQPVLVSNENEIHAYGLLRDRQGRPAFILLAAFQLPPSPFAQLALADSLLWSVATVLAVTLVLSRDLKRSVVRGIDWISDQIARVGRSGTGMIEPDSASTHEVKRLSGELTQMLKRLDDFREETSEDARIAGMSNMSRELLHGVGNVLNNVNVSASLVRRNMHRLGVGDLQLMISELEENQANLSEYLATDTYGQFLIPFLAEMTKSIISVRDETLEELGHLHEGIREVIEIVRSQDRYLGGVSITEQIDLVEQVQVALNVSSISHEGKGEVVVESCFESHPRLELDRQKLMAILINMISNALESMELSGCEEKILGLRVFTVDARMYGIQVQDNGVGLSQDDLRHVFGQGHTTKPGGLGMGLHVAANAAAQMGGFLRGRSDGPGQGACFELFLPAKARANVDAVSSLPGVTAPVAGESSSVAPQSAAPSASRASN